MEFQRFSILFGKGDFFFKIWFSFATTVDVKSINIFLTMALHISDSRSTHLYYTIHRQYENINFFLHKITPTE